MHLAVEKILQLTFTSCPLFVSRCPRGETGVYLHSLPVLFCFTLFFPTEKSEDVEGCSMEGEEEDEKARRRQE